MVTHHRMKGYCKLPSPLEITRQKSQERRSKFIKAKERVTMTENKTSFAEKQHSMQNELLTLYGTERRTGSVPELEGPWCHLEACNGHNPKAAREGDVCVPEEQRSRPRTLLQTNRFPHRKIQQEMEKELSLKVGKLLLDTLKRSKRTNKEMKSKQE